MCTCRKTSPLFRFDFVFLVDALEHLVLTDGGVDANGPELFSDTPILCEDPALAQVCSLNVIVKLMESIKPVRPNRNYFVT